MKNISTPDAPAPAGHYSQAVVYGGVVYVAGMLGIDPQNPDADAGDAAQQTRQALANVSAVLEAAGSNLGRVVRMKSSNETSSAAQAFRKSPSRSSQ